jgi:hypothetical protein
MGDRQGQATDGFDDRLEFGILCVNFALLKMTEEQLDTFVHVKQGYLDHRMAFPSSACERDSDMFRPRGEENRSPPPIPPR